MLLALHHIRIASLAGEHAEVERCDDVARGTVPDAEFRLDQPAPRHLFNESEIVEHLERRRVGGGGPRRVVDAIVRFEDVNGKSLAREGQRCDDADRSAAGNQNREG